VPVHSSLSPACDGLIAELLKRSGPTDDKEGFIALPTIACISNANDGISIHAVGPKALNPKNTTPTHHSQESFSPFHLVPSIPNLSSYLDFVRYVLYQKRRKLQVESQKLNNFLLIALVGTDSWTIGSDSGQPHRVDPTKSIEGPPDSEKGTVRLLPALKKTPTLMIGTT